MKASDVQKAKMLGPIIKLLKPLLEHRDDPKRKLHYDSFYVWLLLCFFTPILDSIRGLQQASDLPEIQKRLNLPASRCYPLMAAMLDAGSSFVGRVRNNASTKPSRSARLPPRDVRRTLSPTALSGPAATPAMIKLTGLYD